MSATAQSLPSTANHAAARPLNRHEVLRNALLETVDLLARRRASEIDETFIDHYVALGWLEWHGGHLKLSELGSNVCAQMTLRAEMND